MTIRVVLADDQVMVRTGLRVLCERDGDIAVVAEAADGAAAIGMAAEHRPDVVLMDIRMPVVDGLAAARSIIGSRRGERVLMLTTYELDEYVIDAVRAGVSGFISKDIDPERLRESVRAVAAGQSLFSANAARTLTEVLAAAPDTPPGTDRLSPLTARESEVLALVGRGMSNKDIGRVLSLSPATVKTHVNRSMAKLDARDRAQLVVLAYESGLVRAGTSGRPET